MTTYVQEAPSVTSLQATIEVQARVINAQRAELAWIQALDTNRNLNSTHKHLLRELLPPEIKRGQTTDIHKKKLYLPAIAETMGVSSRTITRSIQALETLHLIRCERIEETSAQGSDVSRVWLVEVSEILLQPTMIELPRKKQGGARARRCTDCNSPNLIVESQIICPDCGATQGHKMIRLVNAKNDMLDDLPTDNLTPSYQVYTQYCDVPIVETQENSRQVSTESVQPPDFLRDKQIWVCWRYEQAEGKRSKVPYDAKNNRHRARSNDASTWASYEETQAQYTRSSRWKTPYDGIGFMCDGTFTVLDYDHVTEQGVLSERTHALMQTIDTYAELSPSETGIHQIAQATIPAGVHRDIEMYGTGRFLTWTGKHILGTPVDILARQAQVDALYAEVRPKSCVPSVRVSEHVPSDESILERARCAKNGEKFRRLYDEGDRTDYPSHSEADMALCAMLAYWCYGDEQTIDRLFRESALCRDKWDKSISHDETYGEGTVKKVCQAGGDNKNN